MNNKSNKFKSYIKYSNISIQMMVIIAIGTYGGFKLDAYLNWGFPLFIIIFTALAVLTALYISVKDIIRNEKKQNTPHNLQ